MLVKIELWLMLIYRFPMFCLFMAFLLIFDLKNIKQLSQTGSMKDIEVYIGDRYRKHTQRVNFYSAIVWLIIFALVFRAQFAAMYEAFQ